MLFIFDMGGVVTNSAAIEKTISKILGIPESDFFKYCGCRSAIENDKTITYSSDLFSLLSDGVITTRQFWSEFSVRSGKSIAADYWRLLFHPNRNERVYEIIKRLRLHNRVVCGTNTIESHYDNHMSRGDYSVFDQVYASHQLGVSKPDPRFWKLILLAEEATSSETFFIDDRKDNCDAAAALGIHVHQFVSTEDLEHTLDTMGAFV